MSITYEDARRLLSRHEQGHVLKFWDCLDDRRRSDLLGQIESLDFAAVGRMRPMIQAPPAARSADGMAPAPVTSLTACEREQAGAAGERELRAGRVGVILVAGGQGTRLGFDGPKGCLPLAPITGASLFAIHSRKILGLARAYGVQPPFYIMTSEANDRETRAFFEAHAFFGLARDRVHFFKQGMWPALLAGGEIVLAEPGRIFMSPDGHGGVLAALRGSGLLADMRDRGLATLFYFQVDNPLVDVADPAFVGLHVTRGADMSVKVCAKRDPEEGLGVVVRQNGRTRVVEYTEFTREQKHATEPDGRLTFRFGSVAIHAFSLDFLKREAAAALPLHIARKKVPYCDEHGNAVKPDQPNAFKFEKFIFDVVPDARTLMTVEFQREDEFSPVKNATGPDSPATARRDMALKSARWLEACGVSVPRAPSGELLYAIEIDPAIAVDAGELRSKVDGRLNIAGDLLLR